MEPQQAPEDGATGRILIEIMNGPDDGKVIACNELPITMGRATENVVHLPYDHLISRNHAKISKTQDQFLLEDLQSTNGTYIGKQRVRDSLPLEPKKLFRVGATMLVMRFESV